MSNSPTSQTSQLSTSLRLHAGNISVSPRGNSRISGRGQHRVACILNCGGLTSRSRCAQDGESPSKKHGSSFLARAGFGAYPHAKSDFRHGIASNDCIELGSPSAVAVGSRVASLLVPRAAQGSGLQKSGSKRQQSTGASRIPFQWSPRPQCNSPLGNRTGDNCSLAAGRWARYPSSHASMQGLGIGPPRGTSRKSTSAIAIDKTGGKTGSGSVSLRNIAAAEPTSLVSLEAVASRRPISPGHRLVVGATLNAAIDLECCN